MFHLFYTKQQTVYCFVSYHFAAISAKNILYVFYIYLLGTYKSWLLRSEKTLYRVNMDNRWKKWFHWQAPACLDWCYIPISELKMKLWLIIFFIKLQIQKKLFRLDFDPVQISKNLLLLHFTDFSTICTRFKQLCSLTLGLDHP